MGITGCALLASVFGFLAMSLALAEDDPACPSPGPGAGQVLVADRDRIVTGNSQEIVLAGIVAISDPLMSGPDGPEAPLPLPAAERFQLVAAGPPDRYGRTPMLAFDAGGELLQARLLRAGRAVVRPGSGGTACTQALHAAEAAGRQAGAGLWRKPGIVAKATDATSLSARVGLYAVAEGRIVSIGYGSRMVFLDFGRNFRTDFTVMVQQSLVPRLLEAGIAVDSLAGRLVRVRGVIEESGGPAIRLTDPLALEILDRAE